MIVPRTLIFGLETSVWFLVKFNSLQLPGTKKNDRKKFSWKSTTLAIFSPLFAKTFTGLNCSRVSLIYRTYLAVIGKLAFKCNLVILIPRFRHLQTSYAFHHYPAIFTILMQFFMLSGHLDLGSFPRNSTPFPFISFTDVSLVF